MRTNVSLSDLNTYTNQLIKNWEMRMALDHIYVCLPLRIKHTWDISESQFDIFGLKISIFLKDLNTSTAIPP